MDRKNEPAFPYSVDENALDTIHHVGLTKREYFAAVLWRRELDCRTVKDLESVKDLERPKHRAEAAVRDADALIAELER